LLHVEDDIVPPAPTVGSPDSALRPPGAARHLLRRAARPDSDGVVSHVDPADAGWDWVTSTVYRLVAGQAVTRGADDQERLVLVLEGSASIAAGSLAMDRVGSRTSVFDGPAAPVVLVAPGDAVRLVALTDALVVVAAAPGGPVTSTRYIAPDAILAEARGVGNTARRIHHLLDPDMEAGRLIAFEVYTPGGNWSSYPPHKHDTEDPPVEAYLEEYYLYRFAKPQGFGFQRVYTADRTLDEVMAVGDLDAVLVPEGYHPFSAAAGYDAYYLNIMAGPNRAWHFTIDPDHAWLMNWSPAAPRAQEETPA
jgi:5-deoxy-glucuronate isomerase